MWPVLSINFGMETPMASRNFNKSLELVLKHEGGFSNHKADPGGATNLGITLANFRRYIKPTGTVEDLKKITKDQAATCYRRHYWDVVAGAELPDGVDFAVFDFGVNSGPSRAAKYLQKIVGVKQDGKLGPASIAAMKAMPAAEVINRLCDDRLAFLKRLDTWKTFGKGWGSRVSDVRAQALKMAAQPTPEKPRIIETTVEVEKPTVPKKVETEVRQKTSWISQIFGGLFGGGGFAAWLAGMDRDSLILVGGIGIIVIVVVLFGGEWIIRRVKSIRKEVEA